MKGNNGSLYICFVAGAGGNFLDSMIQQLQTNTFIPHDGPHYHDSGRSKDVGVSHWDTDKSKDWQYFSGGFSFNIYINAIYKFNIIDNGHDMLPELQQLELYEDAAYHTLIFKKTNLALNYDDLYLNKTKFVKDVFGLLDTAKISHTKNIQSSLDMIGQFIKTCIDPITDFGNHNSLIWIAWCMAVDRLIFGESKLFTDIADAKLYVATRNNLYKEIATGFNQVHFFNG